jgi:signal transduction histidine kinase
VNFILYLISSKPEKGVFLIHSVMKQPDDFILERERQLSLESYAVLDSLPEEDYDFITSMASQICGVPISLITLVDRNRQWFKSCHGIDTDETSRDISFCGHAINTPDQIMVVMDARKDDRFFDNPFVTGEPYVVFYAGVPLMSDSGLPLGTLCIIDQKPRDLSEDQKSLLSSLAKQVMNVLNLRRAKLALEVSAKEMANKNRELEQFAMSVSHDLKSPVRGIVGMSSILADEYSNKIDASGQRYLKLLIDCSSKLEGLIDGLLQNSKLQSIVRKEKSVIQISALEADLKALFSYDQDADIRIASALTHIVSNRPVLDQILNNLVSNAVKYNDKAFAQIEIGLEEEMAHYKWYVQDNGPGINPTDSKGVFEMFETKSKQDKYGSKGNGIGLALVKKLVEMHGGTIELESQVGEGTRFLFTIQKY